MKRRLLLLNLVLLALIGLAGHRLYEDVRASKQRRETWRRQRIQPATVAPPAPAAPPQPVTGAQYLDVAQQVLFYKDRNPQVILETEKPKEKPLPQLPVYFGSMNLGEGPILVMAEKSDARQRSYQVGQKIGEYQIAQLEADGLVLQFEERKVKKTFEELRPRADQPQGQASAEPQRQVQVQAPGPTLPPKPVVKDLGPTPGTEMAPGLKACVAGDSSPPGTVQDGYRKMVNPDAVRRLVPMGKTLVMLSRTSFGAARFSKRIKQRSLMKPVLLSLLLVAVAFGSVKNEKKKPPLRQRSAAASKQAPKPADPITVPAGAAEIEPFTYSYTDPQGKKWIYRKTPFGVSKMEESAYKPEGPSPTPSAAIKAVADGDSVRFERSGPFGTYKWSKKRSELTPEETAAVEREQPSGEKSK